MAKKETLPTTFNDTEASVNVMLHKDHLHGGNTFVGNVIGQSLSMENIIARVGKSGAGMNLIVLQTAASHLAHEMLKAVSQGHSVDVLGLGTLRLALTDTVKSVHDTPSALPGMEARFTISEKVQRAAKNVRIKEMYVADNAPRIFDITDAEGKSLRVSQDESGIEAVSQNAGTNFDIADYARIYPMKIDIEEILDSSDDRIAVLHTQDLIVLKGQNIKLAGDDADVFFAPLSKDGYVSEKSDWISVCQTTRILQNFPKSVMLYVPDNLAEGHYRIVVRTRYNKNGRLMKEAIEAVSCEVVVSRL